MIARTHAFAVQIIVLLMLGAVALAEDRPSVEAPDYPGFTAATEARVLRVTSPFATVQHASMIKNDPIALGCADTLARAQWRQDILMALSAQAHYDNCQLETSTAYVQKLLGEALAAGAKRDDAEALTSLGCALHAIQDFYSHSSYVELSAARHKRFGSVPIVPVWKSGGTETLRQLVAAGLHSGNVWWELDPRCADRTLSHELINKDGAESARGGTMIRNWNLTHHQAAQRLALQATREFLRDAFARSELRKVADSCNGNIGFLLVSDKRRHR